MVDENIIAGEMHNTDSSEPADGVASQQPLIHVGPTALMNGEVAQSTPDWRNIPMFFPHPSYFPYLPPWYSHSPYAPSPQYPVPPHPSPTVAMSSYIHRKSAIKLEPIDIIIIDDSPVKTEPTATPKMPAKRMPRKAGTASSHVSSKRATHVRAKSRRSRRGATMATDKNAQWEFKKILGYRKDIDGKYEFKLLWRTKEKSWVPFDHFVNPHHPLQYLESPNREEYGRLDNGDHDSETSTSS